MIDTEKRIAEIIHRPPGGRRVAAIKDELGETMNKHVAVFRDADGLSTAPRDVRRLKEEATERGDRRPGHRSSTRT